MLETCQLIRGVQGEIDTPLCSHAVEEIDAVVHLVAEVRERSFILVYSNAGSNILAYSIVLGVRMEQRGH